MSRGVLVGRGVRVGRGVHVGPTVRVGRSVRVGRGVPPWVPDLAIKRKQLQAMMMKTTTTAKRIISTFLFDKYPSSYPITLTSPATTSNSRHRRALI